MSNPISAADFAKALRSQRGLLQPVSAEGFVRNTPDEASVEFSPSDAHCLYWIAVPLQMIDRVQLLGKRPCAGALQDYVILYFKTPEATEAIVYAELLAQRSRTCLCPEAGRSHSGFRAADDGSKAFLSILIRLILSNRGVYVVNSHPTLSIVAKVAVSCTPPTPPIIYDNITVSPNNDPSDPNHNCILLRQCPAESVFPSATILDSHFA